MIIGNRFLVEEHERVAVLTPLTALRELDQDGQFGLESVYETILMLFHYRNTQNVLVDLCNVDLCGSSAIGFFVTLARETQERGGGMALCNVSAHMRKILEAVELDAPWPLFPSRADALRSFTGKTATTGS